MALLTRSNTVHTNTSDVTVLASDEAALEAARTYAAQVRGGASDRDRSGAHPYHELAALAATGLLGVRIARNDGGAGVGVLTLTEVVRTIAAADASLGQLPQGHYGNIERLRDPSTAGVEPEVRRRLLAGVLRGERIADAKSEIGTVHARAASTQLRRDDTGQLRLTGSKHYATGAASSTWLSVSAFDEIGRRVTAFVLSSAPGVVIDDTWNGMGQRSTSSGTIVLDQVRVDDGFVRIEPQRRDADPTRPAAKLLHAAISAGIAEGALTAAAEFVIATARPRPAAAEVGVVAAADDPYVALRLGELWSRAQAAAAYVRDAARRIDDGATQEDAEAVVAAAHAYSGEIAVHIASELFALGGAQAADDGHNLHRFWRDARTHSLQDSRDWRYRVAGRRFLANTLESTRPPTDD